MIFGKKIRELRDEQGVLQRQLAALLEIDTPMFSKIERDITAALIYALSVFILPKYSRNPNFFISLSAEGLTFRPLCESL